MMPWAAWSRPERTVAFITAAYWLALSAWAFASQAEHRWVYVPLMVLLVGVVVAIHERWRLTPRVLWGLSIWGLAHMTGGLVTVAEPVGTGDILYTVWLWEGVLRYDQLLHGYGLFVATVAFSQITAGRRWSVAGALVLGQALGVLNEGVEHIGTWALPTANVGDGVNTAWDLVWNALGGGAAAVWLQQRSRIRSIARAAKSAL